MKQICKIAELKADDFLSGNITATDIEKLIKKELTLVAKHLDAKLQVDHKAKACVRAVVL